MRGQEPPKSFPLYSAAPPATSCVLTPTEDCPRIVLDTNVVLDRLVFRDPGVAAIFSAIEAGQLRWLASPRMRDELAAVLSRGHLVHWQPDQDAALAAFDRHSQPCAEPPTCRLRCRDADDQVFIDLALTERCEWLITHDRALLALAKGARVLGVHVTLPRQWPPAQTRL